MRFQLHDELNTFDDDLLSYALDIQTFAPYNYRHGKGENGEYCVTFSGSYHIVKSPAVSDFSLSVNVRHGAPFYPSQSIDWGVAFGLQEDRTLLYELLIQHQPNGKTAVTLHEVIGYQKTVLWTHTIDFTATPSPILFTLCVKDGVLRGSLDGVAFEGTAPKRIGKVGIFRVEGLKELFLSKLSFDGETDFEIKPLGDCIFHLPQDGGIFSSYTLRLHAEQIDETLCKIGYTFEKGEPNPLACAYFDPRYGGGTIREEFDSPYIRLNGGKKLYFLNGRVFFMEGNDARFDELNVIYGTIMQGKALPLQGAFILPYRGENIDNFSFGYSRFYFVNSAMYGREKEFVFDLNGNVIYNGEDLDKIATVRTYSPINQRLLNAFPKDLIDRENAVLHLQGNHYFHEDDDIVFESVVYTKANRDLLTFHCSLQDAFYTHIRNLTIENEATVSALNAHKGVQLRVPVGQLKTGVYNFVTEVFYAGESVNRHVSTFEVFDLDGKISPQEASGLPTIWVRDGINTTWGYPNPWNPQPDENTAHYFPIAMWQPSSADKFKAWELLHLYRKKLLVWATSRCDENDWVTSDEFLQTGVVKNTDYLNLYFPGLEQNQVVFYRHDYYMHRTYDAQVLRDILQAFLDEHPTLKAQLSFDCVIDGITNEQLHELLTLCHNEWIAYAQPRVDKLFETQWAKVTAQNPTIKRHSYGPYSIYASTTLSAYSIKWFGKDVRNMHEYFDLFQFEDYAFSCSYPTHYSAWCISTVRYYNDKVTIGPELYDSLLPGCADGFVACAKPPQGMHRQLPYMTNTQLSEYIFNSAVLTKDGFSYWRDDTFALISSGMMENGEARLQGYLPEYKTMIDNRPHAHKKAIAILFDIPESDDDLYTEYHEYEYGVRNFGNVSEIGLQHVYATARKNGYNCFIVKPDALRLLDKDNCALLVLPSMHEQTDEVIFEVERIHGSGIPLLCVGKTGKLSSLFGVEEKGETVRLTKLEKGNETELIDNTVCKLFQTPTDANTLIYGDNRVAIASRKNDCFAFLAPLTRVGVDGYRRISFLGRCQISKLLKDVVKDFLDDVVAPMMICRDHVGVTTYENVRGETCALLIDYVDDDPDKEGKSRIVTVEFDSKKVKDITLLSKEKREIHKLFDQNGLKAMRLQIRTHEEVLMKMIEN